MGKIAKILIIAGIITSLLIMVFLTGCSGCDCCGECCNKEDKNNTSSSSNTQAPEVIDHLIISSQPINAL